LLRITTILHPTDFSEAAGEALQLARALARDHRAKIRLVAVAPPPPASLDMPIASNPMVEQLDESRRELMKLVVAITDVPVEFEVRQGSPGHEVVQAADASRADLIVMGTHGRTGFTRLVMGSVAEHVLRHARCPVLVVKPGTTRKLYEEPAGG